MAANGELDRLIINMPPRHGKSEMSSIRWPAQLLGRFPEQQIIHASYATSLSNEFSRQVRMLVRDSHAYSQLFPHVALDPERSRIDDWKLQQGGGFKSVGALSGLSGHGCNTLILDDIHQEGDERSDTQLERTYEWYSSAARTRLAPGGKIVIIHTRWHPRDLTGRLLKLAAEDENADQWHTLTLPALALDGDPLGRQPGEALWPERFPVQTLRSIERLSERYFAALYQQRPTISEQPMFLKEDFRRFERYRPNSDDSKPAWCIDLAMTEKERSDYNVFTRFVRRGERLRVLKVIRFRSEWPGAKKKLLETMDAYPDDDFVFPKQMLELIAVQTVFDERPRYRSRVHEVSLPGDKVSRVQAFADRVKAGYVDVALGEHEDQFIDECCDFPEAAQHDDCPDTASVAVHHFGMSRLVDVVMAAAENNQADLVDELMQRLS